MEVLCHFSVDSNPGSSNKYVTKPSSIHDDRGKTEFSPTDTFKPTDDDYLTSSKRNKQKISADLYAFRNIVAKIEPDCLKKNRIFYTIFRQCIKEDLSTLPSFENLIMQLRALVEEKVVEVEPPKQALGKKLDDHMYQESGDGRSERSVTQFSSFER